MTARSTAKAPATPVTLGRMLRYRLSERDIQHMRHPQWRQARMDYQGNRHHAGDEVVLLVTAVYPDEYAGVLAGDGVQLDALGNVLEVAGPEGVNGQAFLDGNEVLWVTSASQGDGPGQWQWPPVAKAA